MPSADLPSCFSTLPRDLWHLIVNIESNIGAPNAGGRRSSTQSTSRSNSSGSERCHWDGEYLEIPHTVSPWTDHYPFDYSCQQSSSHYYGPRIVVSPVEDNSFFLSQREPVSGDYHLEIPRIVVEDVEGVSDQSHNLITIPTITVEPCPTENQNSHNACPT